VLAYALVLYPGDEALAVSEEAETLAREAGADQALNQALLARAWALRSRGRAEELLRVAQEGVDRARHHGRLDWEWNIRYLVVQAHLELGDVERAREETEQTYAIPSALQGWGPVILEATIAAASGELDGIADAIERAASRGKVLGDTNDAIRTGQHIRVAELQGRWDDALRWTDAFEQTALGAVSCVRPWILAEMGELEAAQAAYDAWAPTLRPLAPHFMQQWILVYEAGLALRTGNGEFAARVAADLEPLRGHFLGGDTTMYGAAEGAMARCAIVEGRLDDAVDLAGHAVAAAKARGWHSLATQQGVDLGRALLGRAGPGDSDRARTLLTDAIETAEALGLEPAAREARSLLA
jgi:tetratricopeptide (TPR) repeat protein